MKETMQSALSISTACLALTACHQQQKQPDLNRPNIIYILADDMGYGDIQALNPASKIPTPTLNQLSNKGITFTDAHSNSAVSTPTRYGILTGRYAFQIGRASCRERVYGLV